MYFEIHFSIIASPPDFRGGIISYHLLPSVGKTTRCLPYKIRKKMVLLLLMVDKQHVFLSLIIYNGKNFQVENKDGPQF